MGAGFPERLLIVRTGAIGDVVNALVFATAVKQAYPATEIGWVVHGLARPLVTGHPSVDRVHVWARGGGLAEVRRLLREIREVGYGMAVDLQRIQKSALIARFSGADRVLGLDRGRAKELSWLWTKEHVAAKPGEQHMVDLYMGFARYLGIDVPARRLLPNNEAAERWADAFLGELGAAPVLVNLGATKPENRWIPERFGQLADALAGELGAPVVFTGSEADRAMEVGALAALAGESKVRSTVGQTDLLQLLALERRSRLFIGCDTGPMHMAAAVGTPCVVLFGPADPERTGPFGEGHSIVRAPDGKMAQLGVQAVLAGVLGLTGGA
ncbi:MAG: heptosyltransferase-1 [Planctomycetota bacterium]|jgi:heptosyltransferase-1